jgi:ribosomal protein S18 acetylase RimI-like enzyme
MLMAPYSSFQIVPAQTAEDFATARTLFRAYAESLGIDLTFQSFESELQNLPSQYGSPLGALLLAYGIGPKTALGCVAVRPLVKGHEAAQPQNEVRSCCEMKRLYVAPEARGMGLGKALVDAIIQRVKELGYREIRLDTLPSMTGAQQLYKRAGFVEIQAYYETPLEGTLFLGLDLS